MFRVILHLDMDAFFAAIEQRDHPRLRGRPGIVGSSPSQRGVVCAASYEARQYGVRSAMPSTTAGRLCPRGILVPPRHSHYRAESKTIMRLLAETGAFLVPTFAIVPNHPHIPRNASTIFTIPSVSKAQYSSSCHHTRSLSWAETAP